jgi:hypothetical protein
LSEFLCTAAELAVEHRPEASGLGYHRLPPPVMRALTESGWGSWRRSWWRAARSGWRPRPPRSRPASRAPSAPSSHWSSGGRRRAGRLVAARVLAVGCWTENRNARDGMVVREREAALAGRVVQRLEPAAAAQAKAYCAADEPWPAATAVTVMSGVWVVCLTPPPWEPAPDR